LLSAFAARVEVMRQLAFGAMAGDRQTLILSVRGWFVAPTDRTARRLRSTSVDDWPAQAAVRSLRHSATGSAGEAREPHASAVPSVSLEPTQALPD